MLMGLDRCQAGLVAGGWVWGEPLPANTGRVFGLALDANLSTPQSAALRGTPVYSSWMGEASLRWRTIVDGEERAARVTATPVVVPNADQWAHDVEAIGLAPELERTACGLWGHLPAGDALAVEWDDEPPESDFAAYRLYWDSGLGGDPDTLLATIPERRTHRYLATGLEAGDYQFALTYVDRAGNVQEMGPTLTATLYPVPDAPTIDLQDPPDFDAGETWQHTLSLVAPADTTNVAGYAWFLNWLPAIGDLSNADLALERGIWRMTSSPDLTLDLRAREYHVAVCAVSKWGTLSAPSEARFAYQDDGAGGIEYVDGAAVGYVNWLVAETKAAGAIEIRASAVVDADGGVLLYRDGALVDDTELYAAGGLYTWTDDGLTDGQEYEYQIVPWAPPGTRLGQCSEVARAVADASAPTGDRILTATARRSA